MNWGKEMKSFSVSALWHNRSWCVKGEEKDVEIIQIMPETEEVNQRTNNNNKKKPLLALSPHSYSSSWLLLCRDLPQPK